MTIFILLFLSVILQIFNQYLLEITDSEINVVNLIGCGVADKFTQVKKPRHMLQ